MVNLKDTKTMVPLSDNEIRWKAYKNESVYGYLVLLNGPDIDEETEYTFTGEQITILHDNVVIDDAKFPLVKMVKFKEVVMPRKPLTPREMVFPVCPFGETVEIDTDYEIVADEGKRRYIEIYFEYDYTAGCHVSEYFSFISNCNEDIYKYVQFDMLLKNEQCTFKIYCIKPTIYKPLDRCWVSSFVSFEKDGLLGGMIWYVKQASARRNIK